MSYNLTHFPQLVAAAQKAYQARPDLKEEIQEIVFMARDEANDGGSVEHEQELGIIALSELLASQEAA